MERYRLGASAEKAGASRYPEWDDNIDVDLAHAKKTRRAFCERYADTGTIALGTHFATPSAGKIVKQDDSFRFVLV